MKKNFWLGFLTALSGILCAIGLSACKESGKSKSAYEIAVENGYTGTEQQWLASLVGKDGANGSDGLTPYIGANGNWFIGDTDTNFYATAVGIKNVTVDYQGHITLTLPDDTQCEIEVDVTRCEHQFTEVSVSPTCLARGYTKYTCQKCGYSYLNDFVPESGHHFADGYCVFCNEEEPYGEIPIDTTWYLTSASSYVITNREELAGLAYLVNHEKVNFSGKTVSLGNNIDLAYDEWPPIGSTDSPFAGTFNGKNLTISNLKITKQLSYVGLFGYVTGTISQLKITNANIRVESGTEKYISIACAYSTSSLSDIAVGGYIDAANNQYVGGVVGYTTGNNLTNCSSTAEIIGNSYVGGIAGAAEKSGTRTVSNLSNTGNVTALDSYVGGLIGRFYDNINSNTDYTVTVKLCENNGDINGTDRVGGLFGYIYCNNDYNNRNTPIFASDLNNTGNVSGNNYVGGLWGALIQTIRIRRLAFRRAR